MTTACVIMRIVTDFDGVLTDPTLEGARVAELFAAGLAEVGRSLGDVARLLARATQLVGADARRYGWRQRGRLSAFADEDVFIRTIALADCLDELAVAGDPEAQAWQQALGAAGVASFGALSSRAYLEMTQETRRGAHAPLDREAAAALARLLAAGHEVVIVSNSDTERVVALLAGAGLPPAKPGTRGGSALRVRGGARKFELGDTPRSLDLGAWRCDVDRPSYEGVLREERPAVVIGDVFSLDLALPAYLARTQPSEFGALRPILRLRPYTPAWVRQLVGDARLQPALAAFSAPAELVDLLGAAD